MTINTILEILHQQPFQPFSLRLADGRELYIPHPDFIAVSPRRVVVISSQDEALSILEPLLIFSIECPASRPPASPTQQGAA